MSRYDSFLIDTHGEPSGDTAMGAAAYRGSNIVECKKSQCSSSVTTHRAKITPDSSLSGRRSMNLCLTSYFDSLLFFSTIKPIPKILCKSVEKELPLCQKMKMIRTKTFQTFEGLFLFFGFRLS